MSINPTSNVYYPLILFILDIVNSDYILESITSTLNAENCGVKDACWFTPPDCLKDEDTSSCYEMVKWRQYDKDHVKIDLQGTVKDIYKPSMGHYTSLAFSLDESMGEDTVLECVMKPSGEITAYVSFNDGKRNKRLESASKHMIKAQVGSFIEQSIVCSIIVPYTPPDSINEDEKSKIFDLTKMEYVLQFARGNAKPADDRLRIHGTKDGSMFPKVSSKKTKILFESSELPSFLLESSQGYGVSRYSQYRMVVSHGIMMLYGWWVFGAVAMFISRYFKPLWPGITIYGRKVWYQLHRNLFIVSLVLQVIAFALIFIQAGEWKSCTRSCEAKDYALYLHTILGTVATALALLQPFIAWIRPSPLDSKRIIFNWSHYIIGHTSFVLATVTIFLSSPLGKSGLRRHFGYIPDYIMGAYITVYIITSFIFEMLVTCTERPTKIHVGYLAYYRFGFIYNNIYWIVCRFELLYRR